MAIEFTLLLSAVAFKLVVVSMLPPVPYFTKMDLYVLACLLFLSFTTLVHSLLPMQNGRVVGGCQTHRPLSTCSTKINFYLHAAA